MLTALSNGAFWVFSLLNQPGHSYLCYTGVRNYLDWEKNQQNSRGLSVVSHWHVNLVPFAFAGLSHEGFPFYLYQMLCSFFRTVLETDFA